MYLQKLEIQGFKSFAEKAFLEFNHDLTAIVGPNGSGKEKLAQIIQANSPVRDGPFVTLNCGALPSELIEAELKQLTPLSTR